MQAAETPLSYAVRGWHPLPLHHALEDGSCSCGVTEEGHAVGKHPRERGWQSQDAPSTADVYTLWERWPHANVGLMTGAASGFWVLDVDPKNGGDASLQELADSYSPLPETFTVRTGSGGRHFYFALPEDFEVTNSPGRLPSGLDVRGNGGQVVAPPSTTPAGGYEVAEDREPVAAPPWLLELIRPKLPEKRDPSEGVVRASDEVARYVQVAVEGETARVEHATEDRNIALNRATFSLATIAAHEDSGLAPEVVSETMEAAGLAAGLGLTETKKTVASAIRGGLEKPREPWPPADPHEALTFTYDREDAFWNARPELATLRQFAQARLASPWAVLAAALARLNVATPKEFVLPPIIGGHVSLNLFVALVGASGGGKDAAQGAARDALDVGPIAEVGVGSGEGFLHQYVEWVNGSKEEPGGVRQHTESVLHTASEVDTLAALKGRTGSTLMPVLRDVYTGGQVSFAYADQKKRLKLERLAYRAALVVGVQPLRAGSLFEEADGGTPQRFLWVPATDPLMPDEEPEEPEPIRWKAPPLPLVAAASGAVPIPVCETATRLVKDEHRKRQRGHGDALDGHSLLTRLKWAAALGLLDGRAEVSEGDWTLSAYVMEVSARTRTEVQKVLAEQDEHRQARAGHLDAEREAAKRERLAVHEDQSIPRRLSQRLLRRMKEADVWKWRALKDLCNGEERPYLQEALDLLAATGQAEPVEGGPGKQYRLTTPKENP